MNKFIKDQFSYNGGFLMYGQYPDRPRFVARFKYRGGDKAGFLSFLIKNFSPEEYFARLDANETPVAILESKGYVSATVKKILKQAGFAPTIEGKRRFVENRIAQYTSA